MHVLPREEREKKSKETEEHPPVTVDTCPRQLSSERALALLPPARVLTLPSPTVQEIIFFVQKMHHQNHLRGSCSHQYFVYSMDDTGAVTCIACTLENSAFAVGWKLRGLTVWSISGCRLMSTICQIGLSSASSPVVKANQDCKYEPMMGGTSMMHWDEYGYRLHAAEERSLERNIAFFWATFA